jgi:hypothetical protein
MTTKADFDAMQWQSVLEAPALAGLIVISAQRGGTIRESIQMAKAYLEAKRESSGGDLLGELVSEPPRIEPKQFESAEQLRSEGITRIRDAVALVEDKATPEETEAYRAFIVDVARRAAEATKSGGVLGVGGERVSDAERAALDEIAAAAGIDPTSAAATGD